VAEVWAAVIGVVGVVLLSPLGLFLSGKLVPVARVEKAEREALTWKQSHDSIKAAFDAQTSLLERQQLTADITDKVMALVRDQLSTPTGGVS
jgi:hypothetical protein